MGGSMGAHTGFFIFHMARRSVDDRGEPSPLYPAAVIMFDVGIIVGAHTTATITNAIQGELSKLLESSMEEHEFGMKDWGVFCHSKSSRMDHVWYIECSSAGVQKQVVATALKGHTLMLLPDEIAGPAAKPKHLQKTGMRFVKEAEEQMDVKEWAKGELGQLARKAYKTARPAINAAIDERLLDSFVIIWVYGRWPRRNRPNRGRMSGTRRSMRSSKTSRAAGRAAGNWQGRCCSNRTRRGHGMMK
jgi:hypothetical protein